MQNPKAMNTERACPRYSSIDLWDAPDILDGIIEGQFAAVAAVHAARPAIESAAIAMEERLRDRGRLVYIGAGTSGRLAVQDGAELIPTFGWPEDRLLLLIAGGQDALLRSVEGVEDDVGHAAQQIECHNIGADDVLVAVAASGTTPFTLTCLREGRRRGALTVGIANNSGTPILNGVRLCNLARYRLRTNSRFHEAKSRHGAKDYPQRLIISSHDPAWQGLRRSHGRCESFERKTPSTERGDVSAAHQMHS